MKVIRLSALMAASTLMFGLCSCAIDSASDSADERAVKSENDRQSADLVDFSGFWEKNYSSSDNFNSKFNLFVFDVQRDINASASRSDVQGIPVNSRNGNNRTAIIGLARLAEEITRMPQLEIIQDENGIRIKRENDFTLSCDYFEEKVVDIDNPFGEERCGWNNEQLIFIINIGNSLRLVHQLTLGPDKQELNLTTTIASNSVSSELTVSNFYYRYTPAAQDFECLLTLTRGNVCSRFGGI